MQVQIKGLDKIVKTYALYDTGSTGCFITESIREQLNVTCIETSLKLQTMHGTDIQPTKIVSGLVVSDEEGNNAVELPETFTKMEIPVDHDQIPKQEILQQWPHLHEIVDKVPMYHPDLEVGLLIGSNCPSALQPLQVIPTTGSDPFAVRYKHGWTVNGPIHVKSNSYGITCHRMIVSNVEKSTDNITDSVSKFFALDFSEKNVGPNELGLSIEDRKFLSVTQETITSVDGHYQIKLPFRDDRPKLPNNRYQAVIRAQWQKKKMMRSEEYRDNYTAFMQKLLSKGYAQKVPAEEIKKDAVFYLPHHGVYHPKKKKLRVVFDCSAKYDGVSLNDMLLQGPDLTNSLIGTLIRFREEPVAFTSDIEGMFYQIKVPPEQHDFLRFLWWPRGNINRPMDQYRMTVHTFGAICSPSIANFALKAAADKADETYDVNIGQTIRRNFYVDDCLKSCPNTTCAKKAAENVAKALAESRFHLTKFISNDSDVLKYIPEDDHDVYLRKKWRVCSTWLTCSGLAGGKNTCQHSRLGKNGTSQNGT